MSNFANSLQIKLKVMAIDQMVDHPEYSWKVKVLTNFLEVLAIARLPRVPAKLKPRVFKVYPPKFYLF